MSLNNQTKWYKKVMSEITIHDLLEGLFNSEMEYKNSLWENFLLYEFSKEELNALNEIKKNSKESLVDFSGFTIKKLESVFFYDFYNYGYFDDNEDQFTGIFGDTLVEFKFNKNINLGYIYNTEAKEVVYYDSLESMKEDFYEYVEGYVE